MSRLGPIPSVDIPRATWLTHHEGVASAIHAGFYRFQDLITAGQPDKSGSVIGANAAATLELNRVRRNTVGFLVVDPSVSRHPHCPTSLDTPQPTTSLAPPVIIGPRYVHLHDRVSNAVEKARDF